MSLLIGLIAIGNILYWRSLEEKELALQHGRAYLAYRQTTWF
jgi:protein-S-isoprenylcysteine O-methyltransferase Ste14